jgi:adenylate cyclase class IV
MKINDTPGSRIIAVTLMLMSVAVFPARAEEEDFSLAGYGARRIEQEEKLSVPLDRKEEVWNFLLAKYVKDPAALKALDPGFTGYHNDELFIDTYFDTPDRKLIAMQSGVRHRKRVNLSDPSDPKSGRELMQVKVNNISANALERAEIKFKIKYPESSASPDDRHPMIGIVKKSQREDFKKELRSIGLDPESMRPELTLQDKRSRIYVLKDEKPFLSISFDHVTADVSGRKAEFVEIEPELNEIAFTEADEPTRRYMEGILQKITQDILSNFHYIRRDLTPKYNKVFEQIQSGSPGG